MPETSPRRKKNSTRTNLVISVVVHALVFFLLGFWAAHEGALGKKLQEITVAIVPPEKKPEPEPEKPVPPPPKMEPPKEEPVKLEAPKPIAAPPPQTALAPPQNAVAAVAPAPAQLADFAFNDGAKPVTTGTNAPLLAYKGMVEYTLRANWERPTDMLDDSFVAEMELSLDPHGRITGSTLVKSSGNDRWDASVKKAVATTGSLNSPPPKGFPPKVLIRFDVLPASTDLTQ